MDKIGFSHTMEVKKVYLKTEHGYIFHAKLYIQTTTPILDAKHGEHYARLMHLSLIWLSPLIFVRKMILKVIPTSGSMCRRLQLYHYVSFSTIFMSLIDIVYSKIVDN